MLAAICTENKTQTSRAREPRLDDGSCLRCKYFKAGCVSVNSKYVIKLQSSAKEQFWVSGLYFSESWWLFFLHFWVFIYLQNEVSKIFGSPVLTSWDTLCYRDICSLNKCLLSNSLLYATSWGMELSHALCAFTNVILRCYSESQPNCPLALTFFRPMVLVETWKA